MQTHKTHAWNHYLILYLLALFVMRTDTTRLSLSSAKTSQPYTNVPIYIPLSCQLTIYNVENQSLYITVSQIPQTVSSLSLQYQYKAESHVYNHTQNRSKSSDFTLCVNFSDAQSTISNKSQLMIQFNLTLHSSQNQSVSNEIRKAYLLFTDENSLRNKAHTPTTANFFTHVIGLIFIYILPRNIQYHRILPLTFNILTCSVSTALLLVAIYLSSMCSQDSVRQINKAITALLCLVCVVLYTHDILSYKFDNFKAILLVSLFMGGSVIAAVNYIPALEGNWAISSIVAVMVAGALIKFLIIKKFKNAMPVLALMWVFSVLRQFVISYIVQKMHRGMWLNALPIFIQIPVYHSSEFQPCSAFGSLKIFTFGLLINYCIRVDLHFASRFYQSLAYILTTFCIVVEMVLIVFVEELPTMDVISVILFYPLLIIFILFFASKRGQWAEIWHGSFYDMVVNRVCIPRSVSFNRIEQGFGSDLLIKDHKDSQIQSFLDQQTGTGPVSRH